MFSLSSSEVAGKASGIFMGIVPVLSKLEQAAGRSRAGRRVLGQL
jgi:hypothetical protein